MTTTDFIIAGRDTTRMLLSWLVYALCQDENHSVREKLYAEIDGFDDRNGDGPTYREFNTGFRYLEGALCETLRLHPSVPTIGRDCKRDIVLPIKDENGNNHVIRAGESIYSSPYVTGRCPRIWGDDCLEFKPERWAEKGINTFDQYTLTIFNINPRLCLGKQFAMMEAKTFMYNFLKKFTFERVDEKPVEICTGVILNMNSGLFVNLKVRE